MASAQSDTRSTKVVPGWVTPNHVRRLRNGEGVLQESGKELPLPPPLILPSSWLKGKLFRRSRSMTPWKDEKELHMARDHGEKSADTERTVFGRSGRKQVQMGRRISGASAGSLAAEKQGESWPL